MKTTAKRVICVILAAIMLLLMCSCAQSGNNGGKNTDPDHGKGSPSSGDLMSGITAREVAAKDPDEKFLQSQARLTLDLFQSIAEAGKSEGKENVLISPLSIQLALSMTANGADGKTLSEMEKLLGGELSIEQLNEYLHTYVTGLPSTEKGSFKFANSIWIRNEEGRFTAKKDFLQTNADYYGAQAYAEPFDGSTVEKINSWVSEKTDGMIDQLFEKIPEEVVMYLINALCFDAEWEDIYEDTSIADRDFTSYGGDKKTVKMMYSTESRYLSDGKAEGFIKPYKDGNYSFAALLPNEGTDIYDYLSSLTSDGLTKTLKGAKSEGVEAGIPKFSYDFELELTKVLSALGMPTAFDPIEADLSRLGESTFGNLYIGEVLHKTFISVDERGTKAGAVTSVAVCDEAEPLFPHTVILDRPFVYMILDNATGLPVFIGILCNV